MRQVACQCRQRFRLRRHWATRCCSRAIVPTRAFAGSVRMPHDQTAARTTVDISTISRWQRHNDSTGAIAHRSQKARWVTEGCRDVHNRRIRTNRTRQPRTNGRTGPHCATFGRLHWDDFSLSVCTRSRSGCGRGIRYEGRGIDAFVDWIAERRSRKWKSGSRVTMERTRKQGSTLDSHNAQAHHILAHQVLSFLRIKSLSFLRIKSLYSPPAYPGVAGYGGASLTRRTATRMCE